MEVEHSSQMIYCSQFQHPVNLLTNTFDIRRFCQLKLLELFREPKDVCIYITNVIIKVLSISYLHLNALTIDKFHGGNQIIKNYRALLTRVNDNGVNFSFDSQRTI